MKKITLSFLLIFPIFLSACSGQEYEDLTRIDIQSVDASGNYGEARMITDEETLALLKNSFEKIKWEPNTKAEMARHEDVLVTLFYTIDKNMPEKLYEYRIWFNGDDSATVISNNEKEGYGTLVKAKELKNLLFN